MTKYDLGDTIKTSNFVGVVSMITITKNGTRYRAYGSCINDNGTKILHAQIDVWENEIEGVINV